jgi:hypothetical protein
MKKAQSSPLAFLEIYPFVRQIVVDKIYRCIIGSALGDTIGLYMEFLTKAESAEFYRDRKFQLVEPVTELYPDGYWSEHFQLDEVLHTSYGLAPFSPHILISCRPLRNLRMDR